jgi:hypothetical protein
LAKTKNNPKPAAAKRAAMPKNIEREVWARAGGICAFPACAKILYLDPALRSKTSFGQVAHNVAALPGGERGDPNRSRVLSQDPDNLILLCPDHHVIVDRPGAAAKYPDSLLAEWKRRHEAAIRTAGMLSNGTIAHALIFQAPIGGQSIAVDPKTIPHAMLQRSLVLDQDPTLIKIDLSAYVPKSTAYWQHAIAEVRDRVKVLQNGWKQRVQPIALFALADMPTLMALGLALGHAAAVTVFQFDPVTNNGDWRFPDEAAPAPNFVVRWPTTITGTVALVLSLSGTIERSRIESALPPGEHSIIELTVDRPTVDFVRSPAAIDEFVRQIRAIVAQLEQVIPKSTLIHVFPAIPASLAITFGRFIKPKVSFPFNIYDAEGRAAPFHLAVTLPFVDGAAIGDPR